MKINQRSLPPRGLMPRSAKLILIGHASESIYLILRAWMDRHAHARVRCFVLDTSADGELERLIYRLNLEGSELVDLVVQRVPSTDDGICAALLRLLRNTDRGAEPGEVVVQVPSGNFPEVTAACRQLATKWFRGHEPKRNPSVWAYAPLPESLLPSEYFATRSSSESANRKEALSGAKETSLRSTSLNRLRSCLIARQYPRRASLLLAGTKAESTYFLAQLLKLSSSWFSVVHMSEDRDRLSEYWNDRMKPDLVLTDAGSFRFLITGHDAGESIWVIAAENHELARNAFKEFCRVPMRKRLPEVVVSWTSETADEVVPLWVTRPLDRCQQSLPPTTSFEPRPEFEEARTLWEAGDSKVIGLIGYGGTGKTALIQHLIERVTLTKYLVEPEPRAGGSSKADGVFVWDFYAEPFPETFLRSFAAYLSPESKSTCQPGECLDRIRGAINRRNLRRVLLVMDGLEVIQRLRPDNPATGNVQDELVWNLLCEIGSGFLPIVAFITTRITPVALAQRLGDGYVQINVGKLPLANALNLLRAGGVLADDETLTIEAERLGRHAMTLHHAGRFVMDFHDGNFAALETLPLVETKLQPSFLEEVDEINRGFLRLFTRYEEHLPEEDVAVLKRLAIVGQPLTTREFAQIFLESDNDHLANLPGPVSLGEIQSRFEALRRRNLVGVHSRGRTLRYATHPLLSHYFAHGFAAEVEPLSLKTRDYFERQLICFEENGSGFNSVDFTTQGAFRSRRAAVGRRGQAYRSGNPVILDLLERIIFYTIRGGRKDEARRYYELRLGDEYLEMIGEGSRAERINNWLSQPSDEPERRVDDKTSSQ